MVRQVTITAAAAEQTRLIVQYREHWYCASRDEHMHRCTGCGRGRDDNGFINVSRPYGHEPYCPARGAF